MLKAIILFALGFVLLIKGGDWFVDAAVDIAHRFHMPELLIGATVVSIGTTIPEVMVSSQAALLGNGSIAFGNAVGSVICNTALISAISLVAAPSKVDRKSFILPAVSFFIAAAFFCFNAYAFKEFSRLSGCILLCMFLVYMFVTVRQMKNNPVEEEEKEQEETSSTGKDIGMLVLGAAVIAVGARLLVDNAEILAEAAGVPESVIALTLVALGTSLPELVTAITSLLKGHGSLSLGNIIGANLFNLVLVMGCAVTINPFDLASASVSAFSVDLPLMIAVMCILVIPALKKEQLYRWQGILLLVMYAAYCVYLFHLG